MPWPKVKFTDSVDFNDDQAFQKYTVFQKMEAISMVVTLVSV